MAYEKVECVMLMCDNCKETYNDDSTGFSIFLAEGDANDSADSDGWCLHGAGEHEGKHYCPDCWKATDEDDVIVVDTTRFK